MPQLTRRSLFRAAVGVAATSFWADETIEAYQNNVNTNSKPSDLKITDLRVAVEEPPTRELMTQFLLFQIAARDTGCFPDVQSVRILQ